MQARPASAKRQPTAIAGTAAAGRSSRPTSAVSRRPTSVGAAVSTASRPVSATRRAAGTHHYEESADAVDRVAANVQAYKAMLYQRTRPLNPALRGSLPTSADIARSRPGSALTAGSRRSHGRQEQPTLRRGDHLVLHRREWTQAELEARVEGFGAFRSGVSAQRSRVAAKVARRQIDDFNTVHRADAPGEDDDDEDMAAREAEDRAAARRRSGGLGSLPPKSGPASAPPSRPRSRAAKLQVTLVQSESVLMRYLVMLDRAVALCRRIPAEGFRRLHAALKRAPTEPVSRAGHESFKVLRQAEFMARAVAPVPSAAEGGSGGVGLGAHVPGLTPPASGAFSPVSTGGLTPAESAASPATTAITSPNKAGAAPAGAGLAQAAAREIFDALNVYHEGWLAVRPALQALAFVCGRRSAGDVIFFAFTALSAHGSTVTPTDLLTLHRYASQNHASLQTQALTLAALGRGAAAVALSHERGSADAPAAFAGESVRLLEELLVAKATVFTPERESMLWAELSDSFDTKPALAGIAAVAIAASAPPS